MIPLLSPGRERRRALVAFYATWAAILAFLFVIWIAAVWLTLRLFGLA